MTQPPAVTEAPATTTGIPSAVPAHLGGEETLATQPRTARALPVLVPMVELAWEEETPSPASAKKAGKAPPVT